MVAAAKRPRRLVEAADVLQFAVASEPHHKLFGLAVDIHCLACEETESVFLLSYPSFRRNVGDDMFVEGVVVHLADPA